MTARAWARFCIFKHNIYLGEVRRMHPTFTSVGENIWVGTPYSMFKPESAVQSWNDEDRYYNYNTKQCTKVCGHYTQVQTLIQIQLNQILNSSHKPMKPLCFLSIKNVWADSYKVGCAAQACPNGVAETDFSTKPGIIFVCNYATA